MPTLEVTAGNDGAPSRRATEVSVSGSDFPPGTSVNIKVIGAGGRSLRGTAAVRADGSFNWDAIYRPKLACNATVNAIVHGSDGFSLTANTEVFCAPGPTDDR